MNASQEAQAAWATIDHERVNYYPPLEFARRIGVDLSEKEVLACWWAARVERIKHIKSGAAWEPRNPDDIFVGIFEAKLKEQA